jgi:hypothetical protein
VLVLGDNLLDMDLLILYCTYSSTTLYFLLFRAGPLYIPFYISFIVYLLLASFHS